MSDAELWSAWRLWLLIASLVVLVAAGLLVTIWLTARGILHHAGRALRAAEAIKVNTAPIWELGTTNEVTEDLLATIKSIESRAAKLAEALDSHAAEGGGRR